MQKSDKETGRDQNAVTWQGVVLAKISLQGAVKLTNNRTAPTRIEVTRSVLGSATEADHDGKVEMQNVLEDDSLGPVSGYPVWWGWYPWPKWWTHFNGVGKITWKLDLQPGKSVDLKYAWNYYWR